MKMRPLAAALAAPLFALAQTRTVPVDEYGYLKMSLIVPHGHTLTAYGDFSANSISLFNLTINGTNPVAPVLYTMPSGATLATRQAGDARWMQRTGAGLSGPEVATFREALGLGPDDAQYFGIVEAGGIETYAVTADNVTTSSAAYLGGQLVIIGTNPLAPNLTTMSSATTLANRQAGDARWMQRSGAGLSGAEVAIFRDALGLGASSSEVEFDSLRLGDYLYAPTVDADTLRINGTNPTANQVTTMASAGTLANRQAGDARWRRRADARGADAYAAAGGYLHSPGPLVADVRQVMAPGPAGDITRPAAMTWRGVVTVPAAGIDRNHDLLAVLGSDSTNPYGGNGNALRVMLHPSQGLWITSSGAANSVALGGFVASNAGRTGVLELVFRRGSQRGLTVRWDGEVIHSDSDPGWLAGIGTTYHLTGVHWPVGPAPLGSWIVGTLSAEDRAHWDATGQPPAWVAAGGSCESALTGDGSSFAGSLGGWTAGGTATATWNGLNTATFTVAPGGSIGAPIGSQDLLPRNGQKIMIVAEVLTASGAPLELRLTRTDGHAMIPPVVLPLTPGTCSLEMVATTNAYPNIALSIQAVGGEGTVTLSGVRWIFPGAISLPRVQPIALLDDATPGGRQARLWGVTPVTARPDWRVVARTATAGSTPLVGSGILDRDRDVLDAIEQWLPSGNPYTLLGQTNLVYDYKEDSPPLQPGLNPVPALGSRKVSGHGEIWLNSTTADPITTIISGRRVR